MVSEEFKRKVARIASDKDALVQLMNELDEEKRKIRSSQRKYSNEPKEDKGLAGSERYKKLRSLKDRISYLVGEREYVRQALGKLKGDKKAINKATNNKPLGFCQAFYAAAEKVLPAGTFLEIEVAAGQMIEKEENDRKDNIL